MAALIAVVVPLAIHVRVLEYDEAVFMDVARNIQRLGLPFRSLGEQGQPAFEHTPLYLYVLSLYAQPSEIGIFGARLVTLAFGLGSVWLTFEIGRSIRDSLAGFVAALLLAINAFFAAITRSSSAWKCPWCLRCWLACSCSWRVSTAGGRG